MQNQNAIGLSSSVVSLQQPFAWVRVIFIPGLNEEPCKKKHIFHRISEYLYKNFLVEQNCCRNSRHFWVETPVEEITKNPSWVGEHPKTFQWTKSSVTQSHPYPKQFYSSSWGGYYFGPKKVFNVSKKHSHKLRTPNFLGPQPYPRWG